MAKLSRGTARSAVGKKKAKKRVEPRPTSQSPSTAAVAQPVQPRETAERGSGGTVLQFRPRARDAAGRSAAAAKAVLQTVDYSYVYTDLRIIGVLSVLLLGGLIALSFVIR